MFKLKLVYFIRFVDTQPIIVGMDANDVQQRSRFIWTNITILKSDIQQFANQYIFLHKIPKYGAKRMKCGENNNGKNYNNVLLINI